MSSSRQILPLLLALGLPSLLACRRNAFPDVPAGYHEFAYVANRGANTVSVLDLVYLRPDRTLRVGTAPTALAVNPLRPEIYAVNRDSSSLSVIDSDHNEVVATISVHRSPTSVAVAPDGRRAFVANSGSNSISIVDLDARRELTTISLPSAPAALALAPDARTLLASNPATGSVFLLAVQPTAPDRGRPPLELRSTFSGCPGAGEIAVLPDSSRAFIACAAGHQVQAISIAAARDSWAARQNSTLLADHLLGLLDVGQNPTHLTLKPDGGEIFVSNTGSDSISEIATFSAEVGGTYTIASHPGAALISSDNATLWICNTGADSLGLYSIDDGRLVGSVRTGSAPNALAFSADQHLLLAADTRSGDVAVIRTSGRSGPALFTILPAGSEPTAIVTRSFTVPHRAVP